MASSTGKALDYALLKRIFTYVHPYRSKFNAALLLTILIALLSPVRPWLIQYTFDTYIVGFDEKGLLTMTLLMIGLLVVQAVIQYYHGYITNLVGQSVIKDFRVQLYTHITNFKLQYFDRTPIGTLVTRVISDMETIADIFSEGLIVILGDMLQLLVILGVMFYTDWQLSLISLSTIPILLVATNVFKNGIKESFGEVRTQVARLNTFVQEHLTGMSVVQIFGIEKEEMEKFKSINTAHKRANIKSIWYYSVFFPVVEVLAAASIGLMIWWGARGALNETVSLGNVVAFILYIGMLFRPIRELADKFNTLQMGMVSAERIFKVLDTESHIENKGTLVPKEMKGEIKFEHVWFAYNNEDWVLKDVSFTVEAGRTAALVGATGAGKSSVINLLSRFYEINKGSILIDGVDIREYDLFALRRCIAAVLQDVFLFSDSITNNITLFNPSIRAEQIRAAAEKVGAIQFIQSLPGGFSFNVHERGAMLSVGQRQLISFIRAYVYNPGILVLDEATSSVDTESEQLIQQAIHTLTQNRTSLVIAHRLATIQHADKIIVLDHGEVKESGTHQELLRHNGLYKKLYDTQWKENLTPPGK